MKVVICSINSKYIHSSLAPWCLAGGLEKFAKDVDYKVIEGTINENVDDVLFRILKEKSDIIGFCTYIWNKKFVFSSLEEQFLNAPTVVDFATTLQEYCQANKLDFRYEFVSQSGTENDTIYQFELYIEDKLVSSGAGKTKKQAKHKCAEKALNKLNYKK